MDESFDDERQPAQVRECKFCLGEHDEDIHAATLNVHKWFRRQVIKNFEEEVRDEACVA